MSIKHTSHARYELWYHIAWATKYRKKVFKDKQIQTRIKEIFRSIAGHNDIDIKELNCLSDHIHMLISAPPRIAPSRAVQILKSKSTELLFKEYSWLTNHYWGGEVWVTGYFIRSVGSGITKKNIEKYIQEQSEEI